MKVATKTAPKNPPAARTANHEDILKEKYDYIWDAINDENFILKSPECNLFKELLYDNKVVGFCSYDFSRQFMIVPGIGNVCFNI